MLTLDARTDDRAAPPGDAPFRLLADHLPALCWMADAAGRTLWCNRRWYEYTGLPADDDPADLWVRVLDPASHASTTGRWQAAIAAGRADEIVLPVRGRDGRYRPFLTRAEPVRDTEERIVCWLGTMTEISSQQEAERNQRFLVTLGDRLRDETEPHAILVTVGEALATHPQVARVGYGEVDPVREIVKAAGRGWNDGRIPGRPGDYPLRHFGDAVAEALWRGESCAVADVTRDAATKGHQGAFLDLGIRAMLTVPLVKHGRLVAILYVHSSAPRGWSDAEVRLVEEVAERTWTTLDRARAETGRRESEALLAAFMKHAPIGMYLKDADGRYLLANPEMAKVFGRTVEEVVGRTAAEIFGPEEAAMIARSDREILETGRSRTVEEYLPDHDEYAWSLVVRFPVSLEGEQPARIGGFDIDIGDAKHAEAELARSREALYQTEKLTALGSLLAGVSHELNNPLSIVLTHASLLEAKAAGTPHEERARKIRTAAERCAKIVQTFLAMARQKAAVRASVDANDVVRTALELTGYTLRTAGIDILTRLAPDLPPLWADADQLTQVLVNLIVNAQHALEEISGARVLQIRTALHEQGVRIEVIDNGPGVPPDIRRRIFEPFFTSKPQGVGTGIGLALSLAIVEAHGGAIRLTDPPQGGACFTVELPAMSGPAEADTPADAAPLVPASGAALVVDDEEGLGEALGELLEQEGFRVDIARSGREAQALLTAGDYDAVLSDLRMPDIDGAALFDWIGRKRPDLVACTAFVTGDTLGPAAGRFLARAGRPVLEKPFDADGLRRVLAQLCPRTRSDE